MPLEAFSEQEEELTEAVDGMREKRMEQERMAAETLGKIQSADKKVEELTGEKEALIKKLKQIESEVNLLKTESEGLPKLNETLKRTISKLVQ